MTDGFIILIGLQGQKMVLDMLLPGIGRLFANANTEDSVFFTHGSVDRETRVGDMFDLSSSIGLGVFVNQAGLDGRMVTLRGSLHLTGVPGVWRKVVRF